MSARIGETFNEIRERFGEPFNKFPDSGYVAWEIGAGLDYFVKFDENHRSITEILEPRRPRTTISQPQAERFLLAQDETLSVVPRSRRSFSFAGETIGLLMELRFQYYINDAGDVLAMTPLYSEIDRIVVVSPAAMELLKQRQEDEAVDF